MTAKDEDMKMFDLLSDEDKSKIEAYITRYAGLEARPLDGGMTASLAYILRFWSANKGGLYKALGNKLIYSEPIDCEIPKKAIQNEVDHMLYAEGYPFYSQLTGGIQNYLAHNSDGSWDYWNLASRDNLMDGIYHGARLEIPNPKQNHPIIAQEGAKMSKLLGKIATAYDMPYYEEFRVAYSMCFNAIHMSGDLCLSIHPLDFMTMSDNDCNWSSCMSWKENGDYRQGTVEMMNSPHILVAYLKTHNDMNLVDDYTWSNKRWRQLYIVTPELLMGIKPYPYEFHDDNLDEKVLNILKRLMAENYPEYHYRDEIDCVANGEWNNLPPDESFYLDMDMYGHMYNDLSTHQKCYLAVTLPETVELNLSGETECMQCGQLIDPDDSAPEYLCCEDCIPVYRCAECGDTLDEDHVYVFNGNYYCYDCLEDLTTTCDFCADRYYNDDDQLLFVQLKTKVNDSTINSLHVCKNCAEGADFKTNFGEIETVTNRYGEKTYMIYAENCSREGLDYFYLNDIEEARQIARDRANMWSEW